MKLIIDIDEKTYSDIQSRDWKNGELVFSEEWKAIHNGTLLPKEHGAEPLDCGNCEIVQASINTGIRTASRLVDDVLDKIKAEIQENINYNKKMNYQGIVAGLLLTLDIIDKYRNEVSEE